MFLKYANECQINQSTLQSHDTGKLSLPLEVGALSEHIAIEMGSSSSIADHRSIPLLIFDLLVLAPECLHQPFVDSYEPHAAQDE